MRIYQEKYRLTLDEYLNKRSSVRDAQYTGFLELVDKLGPDRVVSIQEVFVENDMYWSVWYWGDE